MEKLKYVKFETISLKGHPEFSEKWLQERIIEDPSILGLGDLILKDKERIQPRGGRLDLLFQDPESGTRYEVEIQLGKTDESHIIRTLEYWDIEKKRFPQYDHIAVIVAEDITSRFLNIISLFNGYIPLIALQMSALKYEDRVALVFTKVLDQLTLGFEEEEEEPEEVDRAYWEKRSPHATMAMVDDLFETIKTIDQSLELKFNKFYIGLAQEGQPNNFAIFVPQKNRVRLEVRLEKSEKIEENLNELGIDLMDYSRNGRYRIRLAKEDIKKNAEFLKGLLQGAYSEAQGK
jgi:predicted transport protein